MTAATDKEILQVLEDVLQHLHEVAQRENVPGGAVVGLVQAYLWTLEDPLSDRLSPGEYRIPHEASQIHVTPWEENAAEVLMLGGASLRMTCRILGRSTTAVSKALADEQRRMMENTKKIKQT